MTTATSFAVDAIGRLGVLYSERHKQASKKQDLPSSNFNDDMAQWNRIRTCVKKVEDLELFDSVLARNDCKNGNVNPLEGSLHNEEYC